MSKMLARSASKIHGCCGKCARNAVRKPGPLARHQARAIEKRRWRREERA